MNLPGGGYVRFLVKRVITIIVTWNVVVICLLASGFVLLAFVGAMAAASDVEQPGGYAPIYGKGARQLVSIRIDGVITGTDAGSPSIFSQTDAQTAGYAVKDQLYAAADDELVEGIILEINSPGGTIYGSHAIADGVAYYKDKTKNPVYAHISGMGASGAYWAAASADKIIIDYGSDVGSIGVIMGPFQFYDKVLAEDGGILGGGVITQNGIENITLTAGKSKDLGNPYRRMTADETALLQKTVNNEYDSFVQYVAKQRKIAEPIIRDQIGAMIYDSKTAQELKLVDAVGSRQDAYEQLAVAANIKDDYYVGQEQYLPGFVESLLGSITRRQEPKAQSVDLCTLSSTKLAYHGDVTGWCKDN